MTTAAETKVRDQINTIRVLAIAEYQDKLFDFLSKWAKEMSDNTGSTRAGVEWAANIVAKSTTEPDILTK